MRLYKNMKEIASKNMKEINQATGGIDFYINANKTEFMRFKQEGTMFTLSAKPLK